MLDLSTAYAYEPDTEVIEEPEPPIAIGRVSTEDLTVQVFLLGEWHRKIVDLNETSCEVPFHPREKTRREQLTHSEGRLCGVCFTPRELRRATENDNRTAEEDERRRQREDIDARFKALPRTKPPLPGDR